MKNRTWPHHSDTPPYSSLRLCKKPHSNSTKPRQTKFSPPFDFSALPNDLVTRIAASFNIRDLGAASLACRSWSDALKPLRESIEFLKWGKRFKHGRGGVKPNLGKALDSFLKGAALGSTLSMVDAGLIYWEMGMKDDGVFWYRKAAELGDPAGQFNLAVSLLQAYPPNTKEAITWLYKAGAAGNVRAQYQLALCLHRGRGVNQNLQEAARWYLRAAEGGYARAMYNTSLCYSLGEGLPESRRLAGQWMKKAADHGHSKAQYEYGLALFSEGEKMGALLYLELADRAGERNAVHVRNVILQLLPATSRDRIMSRVDNWRALTSIRH